MTSIYKILFEGILSVEVLHVSLQGTLVVKDLFWASLFSEKYWRKNLEVFRRILTSSFWGKSFANLLSTKDLLAVLYIQKTFNIQRIYWRSYRVILFSFSNLRTFILSVEEPWKTFSIEDQLENFCSPVRGGYAKDILETLHH